MDPQFISFGSARAQETEHADAARPETAAKGANTAAAEFINLNREARLQLVQDTTEWLNQQSAELKAKLVAEPATAGRAKLLSQFRVSSQPPDRSS